MEAFKRLDAAAAAMPVPNVDTDQIIPARFLRKSRKDGFGQYLFYDLRFDDGGKEKPGFVLNQPGFRDARVLVAERNFGCGSSREHAPQALAAWGIRAVVAESLAEIFAGNCTAIGIPAVQVEADAAEALLRLAETRPEAELVLDLETQRLQAGGKSYPVRMPEARRKVFLTGSWDTMGLLLEGRGEIAAVAARLPYIAEFPYPRG